MLDPFKNETETFEIDQLTIENRLDRIQIYGSIEITKDKIGLEMAVELKGLIDNIVLALSTEDLLDDVVIDSVSVIKNILNSHSE